MERRGTRSSYRRGTSSAKRLIAVTAALIVTTFVAVPVGAAHADTVFKGSFGCRDGRALAGARVELWRWELTWLPKVAPNAAQVSSTTTDASGRWGFNVRGRETNWFIRVVLSSEDAEVRDWLAPWNWFADTRPNQNDVPLQNYGRQVVPSYRCSLWQHFRAAARNHRAATGGRPPYGEVVVRAGAPNAGTPWANYDEVWWPANYPLLQNGISVALHEFAHTVRHVHDGSFPHFLEDAARYVYPQTHSAASCSPINEGFAFNEGWAEYWSKQVPGFCPAAADYRIERNVATALDQLQRACGRSRGQMLAVLQANRGRIHSFDQFRRASGTCANAVAAPLRAGPPRARPPVRKFLLAIRSQSRRVLRVLVAERRRMARIDAAVRRARPPIAGCAGRASRLVTRTLIRARIRQLRSARRRLALLGSRRALARISDRSGVRVYRRLDARRRRIARVDRAITARALSRAIRKLRRLPSCRRTAVVVRVVRMIRLVRSAVRRGDLRTLQGIAAITLPPVARGIPTPDPPPPAPPGAPADLVIDRVYGDPDPERVCDFLADVRNAGPGSAPATKTGFTPTGGSEVLIDTPALAAGATTTVRLTRPFGGAAEATVRADATGVVTESNETNNAGFGTSYLNTSGRCNYP